ncbi:MAG: TIGR02996 domain-containing protein [Gemmataceae bacterium]|nr:TIGR02996 domain-containing protein [Gemmataceae bacterium]
MSDESALWAAIQADPQDETLRLAYADWLQEHADPREPWFRSPDVWRWFPVADAGLMDWWFGPHEVPPVERIVRQIAKPDPRLGWAAPGHLLSALGSAAVPRIREWWLESPVERAPNAFGLLDFFQQFPPPKLTAVGTLVKRLKAGTWAEQWLAIIDLGHHGPAAAKAVPALVDLPFHESEWEELYPVPDRHHPHATAFYHTLGCIGPAAASAAPVLAQDGWYNGTAYQALFKIRPDPLVVLEHINDDNNEDTRLGLDVVQQLDPTGTDALVHAVRHHRGRKRYLAAELLGEMGAGAAHVVPALREVLQGLSENDWDREEAEGMLQWAIKQLNGETPEPGG